MGKVIKLARSSKKKWSHICDHSCKAVKVHKGCSVRFEHITVCHSHIDATHSDGMALPRMDKFPAFSHFGDLTAFYNERTYSGTVTFQECSLIPAIRSP